MPTTQDRFLVTVTRVTGGNADRGTFDSFSGGEVEGEGRQYHAGGGAAPTSQVSPGEAAPFEVGRGWDPDRDAPVERVMRSEIGYEYIVGKHAIDASNTVIPGALTTYRGRLVGVGTPDHDSMGRDWSRFTLRFVAEGLPT